MFAASSLVKKKKKKKNVPDYPAFSLRVSKKKKLYTSVQCML